MKMAILGYGVVGSGAYEVLTKAGYPVKRVLDIRPHAELGDVLTMNFDDILHDDEIGIVAEAIGGLSASYAFVSKALAAGKHVVTSNKHLVCHYYRELRELAAKNGVMLRFTSSAGGGIPWLYNLKRCVRCDRIEKVMGILNGTTNFILDAMIRDGRRFDEALSEAQRLGYAEANPSADIDGNDVARKIAISANIAFNTVVSEEMVLTFGLRNFRKSDLAYVSEKFGRTVRYLGYGARVGEGIALFVEPTLILPDSLEANVGKNNNMISLFGEVVGRLAFYGQGAGKYPTGLSLAQDMIDIYNGATAYLYEPEEVTVDNGAYRRKYFIRTKAQTPFDFYDHVDRVGDVSYIVTREISVAEMHDAAHLLLEEDADSFFAGFEPQPD
ncbi:MAG: homoserine dehydrogenase [Clostridia bacterium]|nr:homoserine dehydrogenase [Clostridia bacterium]